MGEGAEGAFQEGPHKRVLAVGTQWPCGRLQDGWGPFCAHRSGWGGTDSHP